MRTSLDEGLVARLTRLGLRAERGTSDLLRSAVAHRLVGWRSSIKAHSIRLDLDIDQATQRLPLLSYEAG